MSRVTGVIRVDEGLFYVPPGLVAVLSGRSTFHRASWPSCPAVLRSTGPRGRPARPLQPRVTASPHVVVVVAAVVVVVNIT